MVMNQEEEVSSCIKFDDECRVTERKDMVDVVDDCKFDDDDDDEGCEDDIADLLPSDPFGMEVSPRDNTSDLLPSDPFGLDFEIEATVAAAIGWIEDFGLRSYSFETDEASEGKYVDDSSNFSEVNVVWASCMMFEEETGEDESRDAENESADAHLGMWSEDGSHEDPNMLDGETEELTCFSSKKCQNEDVKDCNDTADGAPADALFHVLRYLGVEELLSVERVCKSLHDAVQNDPLPWRKIHIHNPLSYKITDDDLLRLTNRAQGTLVSLSLAQCLKITNSSLKHVLHSNPRLTKLSLPGCFKVSVEGILHDMKAFNSVCRPGIKHLRIGEMSITSQQLKEFKLLLGADEDKRLSKYKPRFYKVDQVFLSLDDERPLDIETCPRCQQVRQVYDCPSESCQVNVHSTRACRACILCIARCIKCGSCLDDKPYEETLHLDHLCIDCLTQILNGEDEIELPRFHLCLSKHGGSLRLQKLE